MKEQHTDEDLQEKGVSNGVFTNDGDHAPGSGNFSLGRKPGLGGVVDYVIKNGHLFFETLAFHFKIRAPG